MNKRAITYARVSSDDRGKDGRNLAGQLEMCRDYALEKGLSLIAEMAEDDRGASGACFELEKLGQILEMAKNQEFEVLVVREIDRLSRNLAKQLVVEEELKRAGVKIEYVLGDYDETPEGNLMKHVRAVVAEYERMKINERIQRGKRLKVKSGSVMLGLNRPPYGYRVIKDGNAWQLEIVEEEAQIIRLMFNWYLNGDENGSTMTLNKIAIRLTEMKIPTPVDNKKIKGVKMTKKRGFCEWSGTVIAHYLDDEVYKGKWKYGRKSSEPITVDVPTIISVDVWEKCRHIRKEKYIENIKNRKNNYLFARRIRCGLCSSPIVGTPVNGYLYYRCIASKKIGKIGIKCNSPHFRLEPVENVVWNWIVALLKDPEAIQQGLNNYQAECEKEINPFRERLKTIDTLITQYNNELNRLLELYISGQFPKDLLIHRKDELDAATHSLEKEKEKISAVIAEKVYSPQDIENIHDFAHRVSANLDNAEHSFKEKRAIIDTLDVHVILTIENGEKIVYAQCTLGEDQFVLSEKGSSGGGSRGKIRHSSTAIYDNLKCTSPRQWLAYRAELVPAHVRHRRRSKSRPGARADR